MLLQVRTAKVADIPVAAVIGGVTTLAMATKTTTIPVTTGTTTGGTTLVINSTGITGKRDTLPGITGNRGRLVLTPTVMCPISKSTDIAIGDNFCVGQVFYFRLDGPEDHR